VRLRWVKKAWEEFEKKWGLKSFRMVGLKKIQPTRIDRTKGGVSYIGAQERGQQTLQKVNGR